MGNRFSMRRRLLGSAFASLVGCTSAGDLPQHRANIRVESDPGAPLAGVAINRDAMALGKTDERGLLALQLRGAPGEVVPLSVVCPAGYRSPTEPIQIVLRTLIAGTSPPEYRATCRPELRSLVISVRAQNGAGLPLLYLGQEIARTDPQGAAHALLKVAPGESINLTLDTSAPEAQQLRPQNPELRVTVPERDDVVVFDQPFTVAKPKAPKMHKAAEPRGPVRI